MVPLEPLELDDALPPVLEELELFAPELELALLFVPEDDVDVAPLEEDDVDVAPLEEELLEGRPLLPPVGGSVVPEDVDELEPGSPEEPP